MELKVVSKKQNQALHRAHFEVEVTGFTTTPSRSELKEALVTELKCAPGTLVIDKVHQPFGSKYVAVHAKVYDSEAQLKQIEPEYKLKRGVKAEATQTAIEQKPTAGEKK